MNIPVGGPVLEIGQLVKCKKEGFLYRVIEHMPEVPGLFLERYRLEIAEDGAVRRCTMQDVIARAFLLERYRVVRERRRQAA